MLSITAMSDDDFSANVADWKVIVIKKHKLVLLLSLHTVKLLYSRHNQDRVKVSTIRSCPLYKLVFKRFGPSYH